MCGIAGELRRDGGPAEESFLHWANRILAHRGPDGQGVWLDGPVGLAHRRLAIIDLTDAGSQPMTVEGCTVVYNGEIYNFRELRSELEEKGHRFRSDSDTEVLLRAYLEWGSGCVKRFNGMFAFALWDSQQRHLFCARDRLGIKPFFYHEGSRGFQFASEIKALLRDPERRRPRWRTMIRFLGEGLTDDEWETFFQDIQLLPPAHLMIVTERNTRQERYWSIQPELDWRAAWASHRPEARPFPAHPERLLAADELPSDPALGEAAEAFRALLQDAVRLRLRSDVPVGTCLSGGLDSSSVVACAASLISQPVQTFSSIYADRGYDEKRFIDDVVATYGSTPHPVTPTGTDLPDLFDRLVWHQDEPSGGPGLYSQWRVMEMAQGKVTVLLDGQGGDELLAGYHHYFREYLTELAKQLRLAKQPWDRLWQETQIINEVTGHDHTAEAERAIRRAKRPKFLTFWQRERPGRVKIPSLLRPEVAASVDRRETQRTAVDRLTSDRLRQKLHDDLTRFSIPALLRYEDRTSMAFSLEARVPFLDYRLVEFCLALPTEFKIAPPLTKLVLRQAMNGRLPASVVRRMDKLGYPTPLANWMRHELRSWVADLLHSQAFAHNAVLDPKACHAVWNDHLEGQDRSWEIWRILHTYRWSELFVRGQAYDSLVLPSGA